MARRGSPTRMQRRLTQAPLAMDIDCTPNFYHRIESGQAGPSLVTFARLHHCLDFDANHLLDALGQPLTDRPAPGPYARLGAFLAYSREVAGQTIKAAADATQAAQSTITSESKTVSWYPHWVSWYACIACSASRRIQRRGPSRLIRSHDHRQSQITAHDAHKLSMLLAGLSLAMCVALG